MSNVVICDHCRPEEVGTLRLGLAGYGHTVVVSLHEDPAEVYKDILDMFRCPTEDRPRPDVAVADMLDETREQSKPVTEYWGSRLVHLLRQDSTTRDIRIMPRTRYPNTDLYNYLYGQGVHQEDIINRFATNIRKIAERI